MFLFFFKKKTKTINNKYPSFNQLYSYNCDGVIYEVIAKFAVCVLH